MNKSLLNFILVMSLIFTITGCGKKEEKKIDEIVNNVVSDDNTQKDDNNDKYILTCSGDYSLLNGVYLKAEDDQIIGYTFYTEDGSIGTSSYTFTFDENGLIKLEGKEILNEEVSKNTPLEIFDNGSEETKYSLEDRHIIATISADKNFDIVYAFSLDNKTKEELKQTIEENTVLVCK